MRHLLGLVLLGSFFLNGAGHTAWGQEGPQFGFTIGGNLATMEVPNGDLGNRTSYAVGALLRQHLFGPVSLQSELLLSQKGAEIDADGGGALQYGAGYLEGPVLIYVEAPSGRGITFHGEAGGFGAIKLFEQQRSRSGGVSLPVGMETTFFHRFDVGVAGGLGVSVSAGDRRLNATVRHERGLVDVAQAVDTQPFPSAPFPAEGQTRTWSLLIRLGL